MPLLPPPPVAQAAPTAVPERPIATGTLLDRAINVPGIDWRVDGPGARAQRVRADTVPGHAAMRIAGTGAGTGAGEVRVAAPIARPVAAGTVLLVAVYARAPDLGLGRTVPVSIGAGPVAADAPADAIAPTQVKVGRDWKLWYAAGRTATDHPAGTAQVVVQLPGERRAVELGPVYVLDFGADADLSRLPGN